MSRTLFGKPENKYLSEAVEMDNIPSAKASVRELRKEFRDAETRAKRRRIKRALILAGNRGGAMSKNPQYNPDTRKEKKKIAGIYEEGYEGMDIETGEIHREPMSEIETSHRRRNL